ncbi:MAG: helix-turn-helix transcriptional regulator [Negativicutes bacterium]|nr:helix-turn-helix transcriptional regulator [Negativicutes bacterium]
MLSEQIKRLRKEKKISQRELGLMFNVIKQTVSSWETGNSKPPHDILEAMADFFGVTVSEMYGRKEKKSFVEEDWPDLVQVLQSSGQRATPEERKKIAAIIRASLEG